MVCINFHGKNIDTLVKHLNKNQMTEKHFFFLKKHSLASLSISKNRLPHPFLRTVTVSINFSDKNIKY